MFVASGQGERAVSKPSRNAVRRGVELLSSHVCNQSIRFPRTYFSIPLTVFTNPALNVSGDLRALPKANSFSSTSRVLRSMAMQVAQRCFP